MERLLRHGLPVEKLMGPQFTEGRDTKACRNPRLKTAGRQDENGNARSADTDASWGHQNIRGGARSL